MKQHLILLNLLTFPVVAAAQPFDTYRTEMEAAIALLSTHKAEWLAFAAELKIDPRFALAIVAPEMIRYSRLRDFMETSALEIAYVRWGAETADFSIGRFQMKPSFAETLEQSLLDAGLPAARFFVYSELDSAAVRQARLARLQDWSWQLKYALVFSYWMEYHYQDQAFASTAEKLHYFATAYNYGFEATVMEITDWASVAAFPFGRHYQGAQAAYGDWALEFFQLLEKTGL